MLGLRCDIAEEQSQDIYLQLVCKITEDNINTSTSALAVKLQAKISLLQRWAWVVRCRTRCEHVGAWALVVAQQKRNLSTWVFGLGCAIVE